MPVLGNPRHERVAQLLAAGCSAEDASAQAGYDIRTSSFAPNARKRAQRRDIQTRRKELQGQVADHLVEVTAEWIKQGFVRIASANIPADQIQVEHVMAALRELGKILGIYAPLKVAPTNPDGDGPASVEITWKDPVAPSTDRS
jgi:hypothetical protein